MLTFFFVCSADGAAPAKVNIDSLVTLITSLYDVCYCTSSFRNHAFPSHVRHLQKSWTELSGGLADAEDEEASFAAICKVILARTVECEKRESYIASILELDDDVQGVLMGMVESIAGLTGASAGQEEQGEGEAETAAPSSPGPAARRVSLKRHRALLSPVKEGVCVSSHGQAGQAGQASRGGGGRVAGPEEEEGAAAAGPPPAKRRASLEIPLTLASMLTGDADEEVAGPRPSVSMAPPPLRPATATSAAAAAGGLGQGAGQAAGHGGGRSQRELEAELAALKQEAAELRRALSGERERAALASLQGGGHGGGTAGGGAGPSHAGSGSGRASLAFPGGMRAGGPGLPRPSLLGGGPGRPPAVGGGLGLGRASLAGDALLSVLQGRIAEEAEEEEEEDGEGRGPSAPLRTSAQEIASLKAQLAAAEEERGGLSARLARAEEGRGAVAALQQELDVLRPLAAAKEKAEAAVERLKGRLEELPGLRESLKRSGEQCASLTARCLDLERQADRVAPLQAQLAEAREARAQAEVHISELGAELAEVRAGAEELRAALHAATEGGHSAASWAAAVGGTGAAAAGPGELFAALQGDAAAAAGAGAGVTEFSPELSARLARLERENAELRSGVCLGSGAAADRVARLESDLDDARRIKGAFEGRMRQAQAQAAALAKELEAAQGRVLELQGSVAGREGELAACRGTLAETKAALASAEASVAALAARLAEEHAAALSASAASAARTEGLQGELACARTAHEALQAQHEAYVQAHGTSDAEAQQRYRALEGVCAGLRASLAAESERMRALEAAMGAEAGQAAAKAARLQESVLSLEASLAAERERTASLEGMKGKGLEALRRLQGERGELAASLDRLQLLHEEVLGELEGTRQALEEAALERDEVVGELQGKIGEGAAYQELLSAQCRALRGQVEAGEAALARARKEAAESLSGPAAHKLAVLEGELQRIHGQKEWYASRADVLARYALHLASQLSSGAALPPCLLLEGRLPDGVPDRSPSLVLVGLGSGEEMGGEAPGEVEADSVAARQARALGGGGRSGRAAGGARRVALAAATASVDPVLAWAALLEPAYAEAEAARVSALATAAEALRARGEVEGERAALACALDTARAEAVREQLRFARLTRELEGRGVRVSMKAGAEAVLMQEAHGAHGEGEEEGGMGMGDCSLFELDLEGLLQGQGGEGAGLSDSSFMEAVDYFRPKGVAGAAAHVAQPVGGSAALAAPASGPVLPLEEGEEHEEEAQAQAQEQEHAGQPAGPRPVLPPAPPLLASSRLALGPPGQAAGSHAARASIYHSAATAAAGRGVLGPRSNGAAAGPAGGAGAKAVAGQGQGQGPVQTGSRGSARLGL